MQSVELRHLRYFAAVAEAGHITRAAETLGMQQPPLSQQIRALEEHLGSRLFTRHPRGVTLTDAGRLFLAEATRILADVAAVERRMARLARGEEGQLNVGFTSSAAAHVFTPAALRVCRREYPGIELVLSETNAAGIIEALATSRLNCGLLRVPVARPPGIAFETLLREPVMLALPVDHPLATQRVKARAVSLAQLDGENLILVRRPGAPGLYGNLLALFKEKGLSPNITAEVDRMMTNLNLVAAGVGVSVVPASMQGTHPHAIVYRPLAESSRLDAPLTLAYREYDCEGPTASFVALLRRIAREMPGAAAR